MRLPTVLRSPCFAHPSKFGCGSAQTLPPRPRIILSLVTFPRQGFAKEMHMNRIVYIVGFVVIVIFFLGFFGLR